MLVRQKDHPLSNMAEACPDKPDNVNLSASGLRIKAS